MGREVRPDEQEVSTSAECMSFYNLLSYDAEEKGVESCVLREVRNGCPWCM